MTLFVLAPLLWGVVGFSVVLFLSRATEPRHEKTAHLIVRATDDLRPAA